MSETYWVCQGVDRLGWIGAFGERFWDFQKTRQRPGVRCALAPLSFRPAGLAYPEFFSESPKLRTAAPQLHPQARPQGHADMASKRPHQTPGIRLPGGRLRVAAATLRQSVFTSSLPPAPSRSFANWNNLSRRIPNPELSVSRN